MKTLEKNKGVIAAIVILGLIVFLYRSFFKIDLDAIEIDSAARTKGATLVETRSSLDRVTLDQSLFSKGTYRLLVDFSLSLPNLPVGRTNPFDLIGRN